MRCPMCGLEDYQNYLGIFGFYHVYRCRGCGYQYYGFQGPEEVEADMNRKVVSKSEWGSFRHDGEADMKALRSRAEGAVRYFNNGHPRTEMQTHIFGYPFSIIDNGKLSDNEKAYKGNVIIRSLSFHENGLYAGKVTMSYDDDYNDGRGQGGAGAILIGDVRSVTIQGSYLVISGINGRQEVTYRYLIQDRPDEKPFTKPVPKKGTAPAEPPKKETPKKGIPKKEPKEKPRKEVSKPKETPKPVKRPVATKPNGSVQKHLVYEVRVDGKVEGSFSSKSKAESLKRELKAKGRHPKVCGVFS